MEKISILGFGNPVREDDGVGIYVVQQLQEKIQAPNIEILDMGTSAFEVLFQLKGRDKIILVDAVINSGEEVGTLFKVPGTEIEASIQDDPLVFLHSLKWDQALNYATRLFPDEDMLSKIEVYLISIHSTRFDTQMTAPAKEAGDRLVDIIMQDLAVLS